MGGEVFTTEGSNGKDDVEGSVNESVEGSLTAAVVIICIVAATAGLIFGYDIGISG
jgi:type IV secretory pathway VirB2 component (pilin)